MFDAWPANTEWHAGRTFAHYLAFYRDCGKRFSVLKEEPSAG
jgi:hypothetical protein